MATRTKEYILYTTGPRGAIFSRSADYEHGMWIVRVRARNIKTAYSYLARQVEAISNKSEGVVSLDNAKGPGVNGWPWWFGTHLAPENWQVEEK